jgi:predicted RNA-binding protein with PIN domain
VTGLPDVLIDARNVLRSRWPNIPEEELVELCRRWAAGGGVRAHVVFDGKAPGGLVGARELDAHCIVVGTGGQSADDVIANTAAEWRELGRPFRLVTSDRELRRRVGPGIEVTGGGTFARELRRS